MKLLYLIILLISCKKNADDSKIIISDPPPPTPIWAVWGEVDGKRINAKIDDAIDKKYRCGIDVTVSEREFFVMDFGHWSSPFTFYFEPDANKEFNKESAVTRFVSSEISGMQMVFSNSSSVLSVYDLSPSNATCEAELMKLRYSDSETYYHLQFECVGADGSNFQRLTAQAECRLQDGPVR